MLNSGVYLINKIYRLNSQIQIDTSIIQRKINLLVKINQAQAKQICKQMILAPDTVIPLFFIYKLNLKKK